MREKLTVGKGRFKKEGEISSYKNSRMPHTPPLVRDGFKVGQSHEGRDA